MFWSGLQGGYSHHLCMCHACLAQVLWGWTLAGEVGSLLLSSCLAFPQTIAGMCCPLTFTSVVFDIFSHYAVANNLS